MEKKQAIPLRWFNFIAMICSLAPLNAGRGMRGMRGGKDKII